MPEIAVVSRGHVRIDTIDGRTVFGPIALPGGGTGGPPTVADFDGDGCPRSPPRARRRTRSSTPTAREAHDGARRGRCETMGDGGAVVAPSQDMSSNVTGSTSFDFEGDGRVEAVYADECFARVYDGRTGTVLFSQHHSSCTWYENPVVADVDGDFRAELVVGSNFNCGSTTTGIACPGVGARGVDVQFAGIRCSTTGTDCLSGRVCVEGFCRCARTRVLPGRDAGRGRECTYVCAPPPRGRRARATPAARRAPWACAASGCTATSPTAGWAPAHLEPARLQRDQRRPTTAACPARAGRARNWRDRGLNNFRTNVQGTAETLRVADATGAGARASCACEGAGGVTSSRGSATAARPRCPTPSRGLLRPRPRPWGTRSAARRRRAPSIPGTASRSPASGTRRPARSPVTSRWSPTTPHAAGVPRGQQPRETPGRGLSAAGVGGGCFVGVLTLREGFDAVAGRNGRGHEG
jgi:hypothetical protein